MTEPFCPDCVPYEGADEIEVVIRRSGCEGQYLEMDKCLKQGQSNNSYGMCQELMKRFQQCLIQTQSSPSSGKN